MAGVDLVREMKKIKWVACASYMAFAAAGGYLLDSLSGLNGWAYIITVVVVPLFFTCADQISGTETMETIMREWGDAPWPLHLLAVVDAVILFALGKQIDKAYGRE